MEIIKATGVGVSDVHVDAVLTNVAVDYIQDPEVFFTRRLFSPTPVNKQSDRYRQWDVGETLRNEVTARAPGDPVALFNQQVSHPTYSCDLHALGILVTDEEMANNDQGDLMARATQVVTGQALQFVDKRFIAEYWAATHWTTGTNPTTKWDAATATPIKDIRAYVSQIMAARPVRRSDIAIGMPHAVFEAVVNSDDVLDRINSGQTDGPAMADAATVARLCGVGEVVEMRTIENTAAEGVADSIGFQASEGVLIAGRSTSDMMPSAGRLFSWTQIGGMPSPEGVRVKRWYSNERSAWVVECHLSYDLKRVDQAMGVFAADVLT